MCQQLGPPAANHYPLNSHHTACFHCFCFHCLMFASTLLASTFCFHSLLPHCFLCCADFSLLAPTIHSAPTTLCFHCLLPLIASFCCTHIQFVCFRCLLTVLASTLLPLLFSLTAFTSCFHCFRCDHIQIPLPASTLSCFWSFEWLLSVISATPVVSLLETAENQTMAQFGHLTSILGMRPNVDKLPGFLSPRPR